MPSEFKSVQGCLLLDGGKLRGSFFHRSVVLVCQHDAEGAFGLVLNQSSDSLVGEMLTADLPRSLRNEKLFLGGPVQPTALSYLHSDPTLIEANVLPNLSLGHSLDTLVELAEGSLPDHRMRIFAGYTGWSGGQLDDELDRNSWLVHPATLDLVFDLNIQSLWNRILREKDWQHRFLADGPEDLSWN